MDNLWLFVPVVGAILCALLAISVKRLLASALWLAAVSALLSIAFYMLGAKQVAVIELSVGAGLVTVLFVFAISVAGDEEISTRPIVPRWLAWVLVALCAAGLIWSVLPLGGSVEPAGAETAFSVMLWEQRGLDILVQVVVLFAGVLGMLGLLSDARLSHNGHSDPQPSAALEETLSS